MKARVLLLVMLLAGSAVAKQSPKRRSPQQLEQLADVLLRMYQNQTDSIGFRYVIAYSEFDEGEVIEVVLERVAKIHERSLYVFTFTGKECMKFYDENCATVFYDRAGRALLNDLCYGGRRAEHAYSKGLTHIRSTPLYTFRRKDVARTCGTREW